MTTKREAVAAATAFTGPKSVCICGHTGDGEGSQHIASYHSRSGAFRLVVPGHGACAECGCSQFSFAGFTPEYEALVLAARYEGPDRRE